MKQGFKQTIIKNKGFGQKNSNQINFHRPEYLNWLTINCVTKVVGDVLPWSTFSKMINY